MFMQDRVLGSRRSRSIRCQMWLIPKLQRRVNSLGKLRVRQVRKIAERISEMAPACARSAPTTPRSTSCAASRDALGDIYEIRFEIYKRNSSIKFLNNFIAQLDAVLLLLDRRLPGDQGQLSFGALVAVLARLQGHVGAVEGAARLLPATS